MIRAESRSCPASAPWAAVFMNRHISGISSMKYVAWSSAPNAVRTTPGCSTLAVTPVPSRRRTSLCDDVGGERVPGGQCASGLLPDLVPSCENRKRARTRKSDGCLIRLVMHTAANTDGGALAPSDRPQDYEAPVKTGAGRYDWVFQCQR